MGDTLLILVILMPITPAKKSLIKMDLSYYKKSKLPLGVD